METYRVLTPSEIREARRRCRRLLGLLDGRLGWDDEAERLRELHCRVGLLCEVFGEDVALLEELEGYLGLSSGSARR